MKALSEDVARKLAYDLLEKAVVSGTFLTATDGSKCAEKAVAFMKTFIDEMTSSDKSE